MQMNYFFMKRVLKQGFLLFAHNSKCQLSWFAMIYLHTEWSRNEKEIHIFFLNQDENLTINFLCPYIEKELWQWLQYKSDSLFTIFAHWVIYKSVKAYIMLKILEFQYKSREFNA